MTAVSHDYTEDSTGYWPVLQSITARPAVPDRKKISRQQAKADRIARDAEAAQRLAKMGSWK